MLTTTQLETFKRDGAIIFREFYSLREVELWREQIFDHFGRPKNGSDWRNALTTHKTSAFRLIPDPTPRSHLALSQVYQTLHATADWTGFNELIVRPGDDAAEWRGARLGHVDIPVYGPLRELANSATYLSDVGKRGGAFMYWPGSHRIIWQYFCEFPEDYLAHGERSHNQVFERLVGRMRSAPVEFIGAPGDILIWHPLILHSASINKQREARLAVFGHWGIRVGDESLYDFREDMWTYWQFGEPNRED